MAYAAGTIGSGVVINDPIITQTSSATGDVYYRAADGTFTRLAAGAADTVLTSGGAGVVPSFETAGGGGIVLQIVFYRTAAQPTRTGAGLASLSPAFKQAITPLNNNSDILIRVDMNVSSASYAAHLNFRLYDNTNSSNIGINGTDGQFGVFNDDQTQSANHVIGYTYLYENPTIASTPNSIDIEVQAGHHGSGTVYLNRDGYGVQGEFVSTITLMEIAG